MNVSFKSFWNELLDLPGPVRAAVAKKELARLAQKHRLDNSSLVQGVLALSEILGPFEDLDEPVKAQFVALATHYLAEKAFQSEPMVRVVARGSLYRLCVKTIKAGWNIRKRSMFVSRVLIFAGRKGTLLLEWLAKRLLDLAFKIGWYQAPVLNMLFRACRLDPKIVVDEYVQQIPASPCSSPVFHGKGAKSRACALIGIDFLPSNGKLYFIESNFNPGHYIDRHLCSPNGDPLFRHMMEYAKKEGLDQLFFYPTGFQKYFNIQVEAAWQEMAQADDFRLGIIDDAFLGSPRDRRISADVDYSDDRTLYVISRYFDNPLANFVVRKGVMEANIATYNENVEAKDRIRLPGAVDHETLLAKEIGRDDRFPNIIVKNKYIDQALGIHLYKTDSIPQIANNNDYVVSEYVVPDTIKKNEEGESREYVYLFRTYMLITPDGPVYAGTRKDVSGTAIPDHLEEGEVTDIAPYITNLTTDGDYCVPFSEEEDQLCKTETMKVGRLLHQFLKEKYDLTA